MEEYSYTSTHPLGHTGPVTGALYLFNYISRILLKVSENVVDGYLLFMWTTWALISQVPYLSCSSDLSKPRFGHP